MGISRSERSPYPADSGKTEVDGHKLHWELHGPTEGQFLTLLHHGLGSVRSWRRQIPDFAAAGWRVLAYDRWGYGRSEGRERFDREFLSQDMNEAVAVMDALGVDRTAILGHSDGGSIAIMLAAAHPTRVSRMVLVAAHIYIEPKMKEGLSEVERRAERPPLSMSLEREHGNRANRVVAEWLQHWHSREPSSFDLRPELGGIACPVLVVQGELDEHATPQHAIDIADGIPEAELWLIPDVGHMPPHEIPERFNRRVLDYLGHPL